MRAVLLNIVFSCTNPHVSLYLLDHCFIVLHAMLHGKGSGQQSQL